jgi:hypothetical protein
MDDLKFIKDDIAFDIIHLTLNLNSMADDQRTLDLLTDESEILIVREIIFEEENLCREILEGIRDKQARLKRLEKLSRAGQDNQQPRIHT